MRTSCVNECQVVHDQVFQPFSEKFPVARDTCLACVMECGTEYPVSKFGEEDMKICEEKCFEVLYNQVVSINSDINLKYQETFLEKYKNL